MKDNHFLQVSYTREGNTEKYTFFVEDVDMWKWIKTKSGARRRKGRPVARIWLNTRMGGIWQNDGWTVQDEKKYKQMVMP